MTVKPTPQLESKIEEKVRSGKHSDASEVVRESYRLLDVRERMERLRAAIAVGDNQYFRGEGVKWTSESLA